MYINKKINNSNYELKQELLKLDRDISQAKRGALAIMGAVFSFYCLWFVFIAEAYLSFDSGDWGTFGDFFGGILNPVMGLFALYWLTKSVRLQRQELFETRAALEDAARSQQLQVELSALTGLVNSIIVEVEILRENSVYYCDQIAKKNFGQVINLDGTIGTIEEAKVILTSIRQNISDRLVERTTYQDGIKAILKQIQAEQYQSCKVDLPLGNPPNDD